MMKVSNMFINYIILHLLLLTLVTAETERRFVPSTCPAGSVFVLDTTVYEYGKLYFKGVCQLCPEARYFEYTKMDEDYGYSPSRYPPNCKACKNGDQRTDSTQSSCVDCGQFSYSFDGTVCTPCTLATENGCDCPSNSVVSAGVCKCDTGYTGENDAACTQCNSGTYKDTLGSGACLDCATAVTTASVICYGGCGCGGSTPVTSQTNGIITDGPENYENDENCEWVISSNAISSLQFTYLSTETQKDFVTVNHCKTASCHEKVQATRISGYGVQDIGIFQTSITHRFLQVIFTSNSGAPGQGFNANWWTSGDITGCKPTCPSSKSYSNGQCELCEEGKYKSGENSDPCVSCEENSNSATGSGSATDCICNAGYSGKDGGICTQCETGKYRKL